MKFYPKPTGSSPKPTMPAKLTVTEYVTQRGYVASSRELSLWPELLVFEKPGNPNDWFAFKICCGGKMKYVVPGETQREAFKQEIPQTLNLIFGDE